MSRLLTNSSPLTILNDLPIPSRSSITQALPRLRDWLFFPTSDRWLSILRIGLAIQLLLYAFSIRADWVYLLAGTGRGLVSRDLAEALLSLESPMIPRLGWLVDAGKQLGLNEPTVLDLSWYGLILSAGRDCRVVPASLLGQKRRSCQLRRRRVDYDRPVLSHVLAAAGQTFAGSFLAQKVGRFAIPRLLAARPSIASLPDLFF